MGKVSIGLRGWRFDEDEVFDASGAFRPLSELSEDARARLLRLTTLVDAPCDACWLLHGDDDVEACNQAWAVYGEPRAEVVVCREHEADFAYWYREHGKRYRGSPELQDAFYEWFADGGRAPAGSEGVEHVETDPAAVPDPADIGAEAADLGRDYPTR